jgi:hypothetical protein
MHHLLPIINMPVHLQPPADKALTEATFSAARLFGTLMS